MNNNLSRGGCFQRLKNRRLAHAPRLPKVLAGLTTATLLCWTAPALARMSEATVLAQASTAQTSTSEEPSELQLICVPQEDKFLCEATDKEAIADLQTTLGNESEITATITSDSLPDNRPSKTHQVSVASALLVIGIMIAALWGAKHVAHRQQESEYENGDDLQRQVALLERIWDKSSSV